LRARLSVGFHECLVLGPPPFELRWRHAQNQPPIKDGIRHHAPGFAKVALL
jgi:hypothetical protein